MIFEISYPPTKAAKTAWNKRFGLNAYYSGKHYQARKRDAEELHWIARAAMKKARIKKEFVPWPVEIIFLWNDGLDIDNHAVLAAIIVNAMKGWVIVDDDRKRFVGVTHRFWRGGCIRVFVEEV